jgi:hypothetical protein
VAASGGASGGTSPPSAAFEAALIASQGPAERRRSAAARQGLVVKPATSRRYHAPPDALRVITALLVLRDQVIRPILAGVRVPRVGRKPNNWTRIDRHYETRRLDMQALFNDCGIAA